MSKSADFFGGFPHFMWLFDCILNDSAPFGILKGGKI